MGRLPK